MKSSFRIIVGLVVATLAAAAQEVVQVDFRNYIPGVLDAPVFYPDGAKRLAYIGSGYREPVAQLYYGKVNDPGSFRAAAIYPCFFQGATNPGYWVPKQVVLPDVNVGERIWIQVRVWEHIGAVPDPLRGRTGASKVLSLVVTNPVITLVGLESFRLQPEDFWYELQDERMVLRWQHLGADTYQLQRTETLGDMNSWLAVFTSTTEPVNSILSVTNPMVGPQRFYRLKRWP